LVKRAAQYPRILEGAALTHEPHRIAFFLYDLAAEFHALWNRGNDDPSRRFLIDNNPQLSRARLELALGIGQIIRSGLGLMGVAATEEMR
jgi:arginyl-tRNA synthetase